MGKPFSMFEQAKDPNSRLLLLGEAPGEEEVKQGRPFVGPSGKLLDSMLETAGLSRGAFHLTNVFSERPPENDLKEWTTTKTELKRLGYPTIGRLPPLNKRYILPEFEPELGRLAEEVRALQPEFIILLGGTALWALTGEGRITVNRGAFLPVDGPVVPASEPQVPLLQGSLPLSTSGEQEAPAPSSPQPSPTSASKTLAPYRTPNSVLPSWASRLHHRWAIPTFHPAMILRQWDQRPLLWADLGKARRFLEDRLPAPSRRRIWIDPSLEELEEVYHRFSRTGSLLGVDIETDPRIGLITMVSFATAEEAICIPFYNKATLPNLCNYWKTAAEEAQAWRWVIRFAALANPKVGQNFLYDHQYLLEDMDIRVRNIDDDTAILQHSLQPELPKALGVLASVYLNEPSWKFMRLSEKDVNKADD